MLSGSDRFYLHTKHQKLKPYLGNIIQFQNNSAFCACMKFFCRCRFLCGPNNNILFVIFNDGLFYPDDSSFLSENFTLSKPTLIWSSFFIEILHATVSSPSPAPDGRRAGPGSGGPRRPHRPAPPPAALPARDGPEARGSPKATAFLRWSAISLDPSVVMFCLSRDSAHGAQANCGGRPADFRYARSSLFFVVYLCSLKTSLCQQFQ